MMTKIRFVILFLSIAFQAMANSPKYELRGVWIATVKNIDWPSRPDLTVDQQQQEAIELLNTIKSLNLNTIFLQVRPSSDAFYQSQFEPWSIYLSGQSGKAPDPAYDPLGFWITEAHKRDIDLHAWINPFRGTMSVDEKLDDSHPVKQHPEWFIEYNKKYQYDPGIPECRAHIANIIGDLVSRYDLDGIHLDDYFYPYPVAGQIFNDSLSFNRYRNSNFESLNLDDWRRENVDNTIILIQQTIKSIKPHVAFGISPFGVWRNNDKDPNGSATKAGITNYDDLYADILKWTKDGMIDYVVPQIYWDTQHPKANFNTLTHWWSTHTYNIPLIIGHGIYRINAEEKQWKDPAEIIDQIKTVRANPNIIGSSFYSIHHFNRDLLGFQDSLKYNYYAKPALIPQLITDIHTPVIEQPIILKKWFAKIKWQSEYDGTTIKKYVIYCYPISSIDPHLYAENIYATTRGTKLKLNKKQFRHRKQYFISIEAIDYFNRPCGVSLPVKCKF